MREINEKEDNSRAKIKQRLAGGAVLILVLAICLPFIFNHSHLENSIPVNDQNPPQTVASSTTPSPVQPQLATPISTPASAPSAQVTIAPTVSTPPKTATAQPVLKEEWVIQVGSFNNSLYAHELTLKLNHQGQKVFTKKDPNKSLIRVFVGPFYTQEEARAYQKHLEDKLNLHGIIRENQKNS
jgi:cell division septation protein DedD